MNIPKYAIDDKTRLQLRQDEIIYGQSFCLLVEPGDFKKFIYSLFGKVPPSKVERLNPTNVRMGAINKNYYERSK